MNKYDATERQIQQIKAAIKRHGMRSVTWQSIAARGQDAIDDFLIAAAEVNPGD